MTADGAGQRRAFVTPRRLLALAIVLVGLNLRGPITSLAAVLPDIRSDLGLSATTAGLLTSLPVLCFALGAPLVVGLTRRFGVDRTIVASLLAIALFLVVRPWGGGGLLLAGTALIGLAITAGNVLLPVVVRRDFADRQGPMVAFSTSSLTAGAAITAALTVPLAILTGWRFATAAWAVFAVVAAIAWARLPHEPTTAQLEPAPGRRPWAQPGAWVLALYFAMQSGLYYATTAWLPSLLPEVAHVDAATAGTSASVFQLVGIAGTLVGPVLAARVRARRLLTAVVASCWLVFCLGLLLAPTAYLLWSVIGGFGQGGGFAIGIALLALRAANVDAVRQLSAMVQTVGYTVGAAAPVVAGAAFGATGQWTATLLLFAGMAVLMVISGAVAGSHHTLR